MARPCQVDKNKIKVFATLANTISRGDPQPSLRELAAQVSLSHEHVRACLIRLESEGYIKRKPLQTRTVKIEAWPKEAEALAA